MSSKFLFQNARIKAIENKLLSPQQLQRIIDCGSVADAFKLLLELGFGQGVSVTNGDFDALFSQEEKTMLEIIRSFNVDGALDAILVAGDVNNLKALYKSQCSGVAPTLMSDGVYSLDALKTAIAGDVTVLDGVLGECLISLNKSYADEKLTPRMIDTLLDKVQFELQAKWAKKGGKEVVKFFERKADMANVLSFVRAKKLGLSSKFFEEGFVGGGILKEEGFISIFDGALDGLKELCRYTDYRDDVFKLVDDGNLVAFEVSVDNFNLAYWREKYNDLFSVAPIVYYYFAKMTELKAVKLIVAGIKNSVDPALIKERMREIYGA